jgi:ABC-2 type transport system ATP-binding protein
MPRDIYLPGGRPSELYDLLVAETMVPVRGLFLLVVLFSVAIGPVNVWLLSKYRKRIWLWWNVPAISLATCLAVFLYAMMSEGWTARGKTASLTLLDERCHRATTIGYVSLYCPLTPSRGLHFGVDTDVALLSRERSSYRYSRYGRREGGPYFVDWTSDQHLASGWVTARVPAYFQFRKNEDRRERLSVEKKADGSVVVVNALGADIRRVYLADASGRVFEGRDIAAGAERTLVPAAGTGRRRQAPRPSYAGCLSAPTGSARFAVGRAADPRPPLTRPAFFRPAATSPSWKNPRLSSRRWPGATANTPWPLSSASRKVRTMDVRIVSLKRYFGKTKAVDDVSFEFSSGQIFGFVGPNGAGKTTTMRILATLDEPTDGNAYVNGVSVVDDPERARRHVGFMPDTLPAHRDMTVHEYLDFFARAYALRGAKRRAVVESVEQFANLRGIRDKLLPALSKGMKQRVSLARALVHDPPVLVLDEPAAGLDPRARIELRELLRVLADRGKAVLISSHILTELAEICNGAVIIEQGKILRAGPMEQILTQQSPLRTIAIRAAGGPEALYRELVQLPGVREARVAGEGLEIDVEGGDDAASAILAHLVGKGFRVADFHQRQADLEDVFMTVTKGEVQ